MKFFFSVTLCESLGLICEISVDPDEFRVTQPSLGPIHTPRFQHRKQYKLWSSVKNLILEVINIFIS